MKTKNHLDFLKIGYYSAGLLLGIPLLVCYIAIFALMGIRVYDFVVFGEFKRACTILVMVGLITLIPFVGICGGYYFKYIDSD